MKKFSLLIIFILGVFFSACNYSGQLFLDFSVSQIALCVGQSYDLSNLINSKEDITYELEVSDESVLTINNSVITALKEGSTSVKLTSNDTLSTSHSSFLEVNVGLHQNCIKTNKDNYMMELGENLDLNSEILFLDVIKNCELEVIINDNFVSFNKVNNILSAIKVGEGEVKINALDKGVLYASINIYISVIEKYYVSNAEIVGIENNTFFVNSSGEFDYEIEPIQANQFYFEVDSDLMEVTEDGKFEIYENTGNVTIHFFYKTSKNVTEKIQFSINIIRPISIEDKRTIGVNSVVCNSLICGEIFKYSTSFKLSSLLDQEDISFTNCNVSDCEINGNILSFDFYATDGENIKMLYSSGYQNYYENEVLLFSNCFVSKSDLDFSFSFLEEKINIVNGKIKLFLLNNLENWNIKEYPTSLNLEVNVQEEEYETHTVNFYDSMNLETNNLLYNNGLITTAGSEGEYSLKIGLFGQLFDFCIIVAKVKASDFKLTYNSNLKLNSFEESSTSLIVDPIPKCAFNYNDYEVINNSTDLISVNNENTTIIAVGNDASITISFGNVSKTFKFNLSYKITEIKLKVDDNYINTELDCLTNRGYLVNIEVYSGEFFITNQPINVVIVRSDIQNKIEDTAKFFMISFSSVGSALITVSSGSYSQSFTLNFD